MERLEARYVRISRASAILETAKQGLKGAESYIVNQHLEMLADIAEDAAEIRKATQ